MPEFYLDMALNVKNISINIGDREIVTDQSFGLGDGTKAGLIGRNGAGKTTLLKAILGKQEYHGNIEFNGKAAYFSQHIELDLHKTVGQTLGESATIHHQNEYEEEMKKVEDLLSRPETYQNSEQVTKLTDRFVDLQAKIAKQQDNRPTNKIKSALQILEIKDSWLQQKVSLLSTGQRAIVALAQILSSEADLLLLDEPTNHLDFKRLDILEKHLRDFKGTVLMVTHDRYFLDRVCDKILKMEKGKILKYNSNYTGYIKAREAEFEAQKYAYEQENKYIANEKDKIARIGKSPLKVKQGKYREKLLEKREVLEKPDLDKSKFSTVIDSSPIHAMTILELENLTVGYDKPLISHIDLRVNVGERYVLIGENGIGKSTLFKTIEGRLPPLSGKVRLHSQGRLGYVDQELKDLSNHATLYDEIYAIVKDNYTTRQQLSIGGFVEEEDVFKPIALLSLGEKARLNLIKVLIYKPNLLLLDEPTNHLDIDAREIIEKAFLSFNGSILAVSHDRYFINKIAQRILKVSDGTIKEVTKK